MQDSLRFTIGRYIRAPVLAWLLFIVDYHTISEEKIAFFFSLSLLPNTVNSISLRGFSRWFHKRHLANRHNLTFSLTNTTINAMERDLVGSRYSMQISKRWFQIAFEIRRSQFDFRPGRKFALMKIHTRRTSASIFHVSCSLLYHRFSTRFFYEYLTPVPVWSFTRRPVSLHRDGGGKKKDLYWEPLAQRITINRYPFAHNQRRSHVTSLNCAYFTERIFVVRLRLSFDLIWEKNPPSLLWHMRSSLT